MGDSGAEQAASDTPVPSLHDVLGGTAAWHATSMEVGEAATAPTASPRVTEARYSLDDRDSQRVAGFVQKLFPDLYDAHSVESGTTNEDQPLAQPPTVSDDMWGGYSLARNAEPP